jgi:hypothetical protein
MIHPVNRLMNSLRGIQGPAVWKTKVELATRIDNMLREDPIPEPSPTTSLRADEYSPIKPPDSWKLIQRKAEIDGAYDRAPWKTPKYWRRVAVVAAIIFTTFWIAFLTAVYALRAKAPQVTHGVSQNSMDRSRRRDERVREGKFEHSSGGVFVSVQLYPGNSSGPDPDAPKEGTVKWWS